MLKINNEKDFYALIRKMLNEKRITEEEYEAMGNYVCGIFDALSGNDMYEEDFM